MVNIPPDEKLFDKRERPSGQLDKLYCKKCKTTLNLRTINIIGNKIKCKKCGMVVLELKD
jgi:NAD-dependent SIR2 family protein deacetylase